MEPSLKVGLLQDAAVAVMPSQPSMLMVPSLYLPTLSTSAVLDLDPLRLGTLIKNWITDLHQRNQKL